MDASAAGNQSYPRWTELFLGILKHPNATLKRLNELCDSADSSRCAQQAFNAVFLSALVLGGTRFNPADGSLSIFESLGALTNVMLIWVFAAATLSLFSMFINEAKPTKWKKSLVLTGWSLVPVIFFAPMICFKNAIGPLVLPIAVIPTVYTLYLMCTGYKLALGVSSRKLIVMAMVAPPLVFLVYLFWAGLSIFVLIAEIISSPAFQR